MRGYGSLQKEFQFFVLKRFSWFSPMQYLTKKSKLSKVFDILGIISASLDMVCKESWEKAFYFCWRVQMRVRRYAMHVIYSWCCFIENYNHGVSCSLLPQWLCTYIVVRHNLLLGPFLRVFVVRITYGIRIWLP